MKKIFLIGAVAFFAACNSDSKSDMDTKKEIVTDTSAQFKNSVNTDTAKTTETLAAPVPKKMEAKKEVSKKETRTSTVKAHTATAPVTTTQTPASSTTTTKSTQTPAPATTTD